MRAFEVVRSAFHRPETRIYAWVQGLIWTLIALSVMLLALELGLGWRVDALDRAVLWFFGAELALRVLSYRPPALDIFKLSPTRRLRVQILGRLAFCFQPLVLIDLITVLALVPALRGLRTIRLLRLFRGARLFRYHNPFRGLARAFQENGLLFTFAFSVLGIATLLGGTSLWLIERTKNPAISTFGDGLWWAIVTLTTVGFGDIAPSTLLGRLLGTVLMIMGLFILALFAGIVGRTMIDTVISLREEQFRMGGYNLHLVICGYDAGARMLLDSVLKESDIRCREVLIFAPGDRPEDLPPDFTWVGGDPTKESELHKIRLNQARAVIVVASRDVAPQQADATTILTIFTLRSYLAGQQKKHPRQTPLYLVAEIIDSENVEHARTAGANEVIETNRLGFSLLAHAAAAPGTARILGRVAAAGAHSMFLGRLPAGSEDGETEPRPRTFGELASELKDSNALLIGVLDPRNGQEHINPPDYLIIEPPLKLIYLAEQPALPAS